MDFEKNYVTPTEVVKAVKSITNDEVKLKPPVDKSIVVNVSSSTEVNTIESESKEIMHLPADNVNESSMEAYQKGRVSLIRLQAAHPNPMPQESKNEEFSVAVPDPTSGKPSNQSVTQACLVPSSYSWKASDSGLSEVTKIDSFDPNLSSPSEGIQALQVLTSTSGLDKISNTLDIDRFLTSDGQYVYGYKDSSGEVQFFCPAPNDRENHNEKERQRRSRVSESCSKLRKLVPGLSSKTDKATVFEQTVKYLRFFREKYGTQFDQMYCEKYFKGEK